MQKFEPNWIPGFDPNKKQFTVELSANQIDALHSLIENQYATEDQQIDVDEEVSHTLACLFDDLFDGHVTTNQLHLPCVGGLGRMMELTYQKEE
jgi:hypothetical protein